MKILYLAHPEQDYGEYYLFNGLCQIYGSENIITYPIKKSYYGMVDDEYILDNGDIGYTAPGDYITKKPINTGWSFNRIIENIEEFDFILLSSARTYAVNALQDICDHLDGCPIPIVFTDHDDGDNIRQDIINDFKPSAVFKREIAKSSPPNCVIPLPFSSAIDSFPDIDDQVKEYSVFCCLGATWPFRRELVEKLIDLNYKDAYVSIDTKIRGDYQEKNQPRLSYKDYLEKIAKSKIAISVRGHGRDTVRYWEIAGYETLMLICDPGLVIPNDFEDGVNAVFFKSDLSDLQEKIDYYLAHDDERISIAREGKAHLLKYHTNQARAQYFMGILNERKVIEND